MQCLIPEVILDLSFWSCWYDRFNSNVVALINITLPQKKKFHIAGPQVKFIWGMGCYHGLHLFVSSSFCRSNPFFPQLKNFSIPFVFVSSHSMPVISSYTWFYLAMIPLLVLNLHELFSQPFNTSILSARERICLLFLEQVSRQISFVWTWDHMVQTWLLHCCYEYFTSGQKKMICTSEYAFSLRSHFIFLRLTTST